MIARAFYHRKVKFTGSQTTALIFIHKSVISGRYSHQAILSNALRVDANLLQTDLCRSRRPRGANSGYMDVFKLTIHGTGYPLPGGYDGLAH